MPIIYLQQEGYFFFIPTYKSLIKSNDITIEWSPTIYGNILDCPLYRVTGRDCRTAITSILS